MDEGRWQHVSHLYNEAMALGPPERIAFLQSACGDDVELRREVEGLLAHELDTNIAMDAVSAEVGVAARGAAIGTHLGGYRLDALIGSGAMGDVYRAHDTSLGRDVAVKILPLVFASDPSRRERFTREARLLAALNHPNIAVIHGLVEQDGLRGLVLELLPGESLAEKLRQLAPARGKPRGLPLADVEAIGRQLVDALDAAHERGIVHRDLKPANIQIAPDGVVKVLDFGLATAAGRHEPTTDISVAETVAPNVTHAGAILGTPAYMSPEQAAGRPVDKRTDIWAFGCVLFEMLTNRGPFAADSPAEMVAAIVEREPDWSLLPPETPARLVTLMRRCLQKNSRQRLRDIGDAVEQFDPSVAIDGDAPILPNRRATLGWALAALVVGVLAASAAFMRLSPADSRPAAPTFARVVRLTSGPANEFGPAISPDGKWVAYFSNERGPTDIWVRFTTGGDAINLTNASTLELPSRIDIGGLAISPDGRTIAFDAGVTRGTPANLFDAWVIDAPLGGLPRKLVERGRSVRWSPDGRRIVYIRAGAAAGDSLYVADADGDNERLLLPTGGGLHHHWPAWSADGRYIYFITSPSTANSEPAEIYRVPSAGGVREAVVTTARRAVFPAPTLSGLIYAANPLTADLALWWKPLASDAPPVSLGTAVGEYSELSSTPDGGRLVATLINVVQTLTTIDGNTGEMRPLSEQSVNGASDFGPSLSPRADRLVFSTERDGSRSLWLATSGGSDRRPLTSGPSFDERPVFSPDGRRIAFVSDRGGRRGIWVIDAEGGAARLVANATVLDSVTWSPDGSELAFATPVDAAPGLSAVSLTTGAIRRIPTPGPATSPAWSPRADVIAYVEARPPAQGQPSSSRVAYVDSSGRSVLGGVSGSPNVLNGSLAWHPDGRHLAAIVEPGANAGTVWVIDTTGQEPTKRLASLVPPTRSRGATWFADGSKLLIGLVKSSSDIVLFER